jgi:hypothetical protein
MTDFILALIFQFGTILSPGITFVDNEGVGEIRAETGVDIRTIESDENYQIYPEPEGVKIVGEDQNGGGIE